MSFNNTCTSTLSEDGEVSYHSELMKNYVAESPVDGSHQLKVIHNGETPLLFSINAKQELFVIYPKDGTMSGWEQHKLSKDLGEVTAFDISQDVSGAFLVGMATKNEGVTSLFINELTQLPDIDWETFEPASFWQKFELENNKETINLIKADPEGILFATETESQDAKYYTLDAKSGIQQYQLPENSSTVLQMGLGKVHGNRGVFLLYQLGENQTMLFQSFPDPKYHKTATYRYDTGGPLEDFVLIQGEESTDHLYTAGDGVFLFTDPTVLKQTVVEKTGEINFKHIEVTTKADKITIWLRGEEQGQKRNLYLVENQFHWHDGTINSQWNKPLPLMSNVEQFTCLCSDEISNHLFYIKSDNTLSHFWQDAATTLWDEKSIFLPTSNKGREIDTYSLTLQCDPKHFGKKVRLRTSSAAYVNINAIGYCLLTPNKYVEISLGAMGTINLMKEVTNITAPILYVEADFLKNDLVIDLTHKTCERLRTLQKGKDLDNAKKQDSTSLWKGKENKPNYDTMNKASQVIQKLLDAKEHLEKEPANQNGVNEIWHLQFNNKKKISLYSGSQAEQNLQSLLQKNNINYGVSLANFDPLNDFGHSIGSFLQWVGDRVVDITNFVFEVMGSVVTFVIEIAGEIYKFVIKTGETVLSAMMWIFDKISLFLNDLIEWIGFVFNWDDILRTKNVFKGIVNCSMNSAEDQLCKFQGNVHEFFNRFREDVMGKRPELPSDIANKKISQDSKPTASPLNTPQVSWANQYLTNPKTYQPKVPIKKDEITLEGLAEDQLRVFKDAFSQLGDEFMLNIPKLDIGTLISRMFDIVSTVVVDTAENITLAIIEIVKQAMHSLQNSLNHPWDIYLLTWLYEEVIAPGSKLSLLDLICLLIAIPCTVLCKISTNVCPFSEVHEKAVANISNISELFVFFTKDQFRNVNEKRPYYTQKSNKKRARTSFTKIKPYSLKISGAEKVDLNTSHIYGYINTALSFTYNIVNILSFLGFGKIFSGIVGGFKILMGFLIVTFSLYNFYLIPEDVPEKPSSVLSAYEITLTLCQYLFVALDIIEFALTVTHEAGQPVPQPAPQPQPQPREVIVDFNDINGSLANINSQFNYTAQSNSTTGEALLLSIAVSIFGILNLIAFCFLYSFERDEEYLDSIDIQMKLTQNIFFSLVQIACGPCAFAVNAGPQVRLGAIVSLTALTVLCLGFQCGRVVKDQTDSRFHKVV